MQRLDSTPYHHLVGYRKSTHLHQMIAEFLEAGSRHEQHLFLDEP